MFRERHYAAFNRREDALVERTDAALIAGAVPSPPHPTLSYPNGLTAREVEVLRHLAGGRTNTQIARELFVSVRTVERHVANIYAKIGSRGRARATAYALTRGLL